jgi:hypothetical protein
MNGKHSAMKGKHSLMMFASNETKQRHLQAMGQAQRWCRQQACGMSTTRRANVEV